MISQLTKQALRRYPSVILVAIWMIAAAIAAMDLSDLRDEVMPPVSTSGIVLEPLPEESDGHGDVLAIVIAVLLLVDHFIGVPPPAPALAAPCGRPLYQQLAQYRI